MRSAQQFQDLRLGDIELGYGDAGKFVHNYLSNSPAQPVTGGRVTLLATNGRNRPAASTANLSQHCRKEKQEYSLKPLYVAQTHNYIHVNELSGMRG